MGLTGRFAANWIKTTLTPDRWLQVANLSRRAHSIAEREGVDHVAHGHRDVLAAVHCIGHGRSVDLAAEGDVPQRLAGQSIERKEIAIDAGAEDDAAGRRENPCASTRRNRELPAQIAVARVESTETAIAAYIAQK